MIQVSNQQVESKMVEAVQQAQAVRAPGDTQDHLCPSRNKLVEADEVSYTRVYIHIIAIIAS